MGRATPLETGKPLHVNHDAILTQSAAAGVQSECPRPGTSSAVRKLFGADADRVLALNPPGQTEDQVLDAAQTLATDQGMGYNLDPEIV